MNYRYKIFLSLPIIFTLSILTVLAFHGTVNAEAELTRESTNPLICNRMDELSNKIEKNLSNKQQALDKRRNEQSKKIQNNHDNKTAEITKLRNQWDKNRSNHYDKLNEKATTQEQKDAIEQFKNAIESAVAKRRATFDQATQDYRDTIDYAINNKQNGIDQVVSIYKTNIGLAKDQLNQDCQQNKTDSEIRSKFNKSIEEAKNALNGNVNGVDQIALQVNQAKQARASILNQSVQEFRSTVESAKLKLQTALSQQ